MRAADFSQHSTCLTDACQHMGYIKNNAFVTMNNDFLSRVRLFSNDFHQWLCHSWKSLPNRLTRDKKSLSSLVKIIADFVTCENHCRIASHVTKQSLFTVTNVLSYFLHAILCPEQTALLETIINPWLHNYNLALWHHHSLICDITRTWGTSIVMSYSSIVLARANWCKCDLH